MLQHEALTIRTPGHADCAASLINLVNCLWVHYRQLRAGDPVDLDEAIDLLDEALKLCPSGHPHRALPLDSLGVALYTRYAWLGNNADLDKAIVLLREALGLRPVGHPKRETSLSNLANVLDIYIRRTRNHVDLNEAIALHREALNLRSTGHPGRGYSLSNLATALEARYEWFGNHADLDELVQLSEEHVGEHPGAWASLGRLARIKSQPQLCHSNPAEALDLLAQLLLSPSGNTQRLLHQVVSRLGALSKAYTLDDCLRRRLVDVYFQAFKLMPQAANLGLDLHQRLHAIIDAEPAATMAASHALCLHDIPLALTLLEQGQAVFWQQAL